MYKFPALLWEVYGLFFQITPKEKQAINFPTKDRESWTGADTGATTAQNSSVLSDLLHSFSLKHYATIIASKRSLKVRYK